ncbi:mycofactocin precursor MftA [Nocardioides allogilvus]|nr:mycofactocin precursor MftA [Nocardioides allogilvus]
MTDPTQNTAAAPTLTDTEADTAPLAEGELVEEVSIDGMCGVY